jgi:hypothetical protein
MMVNDIAGTLLILNVKDENKNTENAQFLFCEFSAPVAFCYTFSSLNRSKL